MKKINSIEGFSLLEVLIAMFVLVVGVFTMYSMQIGALKGNTKSQLITEASNEARNQIEQLLDLDYDAAGLTNGGPYEVTSTVESIKSVEYTVTDWRTDTLDNDNDGNFDEFDERGVKNVEITVAYDVNGVEKTISITLLKSEVF